MRLVKLISLVAFTSCALITVNAQDKLGYLKEWVGKYPADNATKPHRALLKLPEVRKPLLSLLSKPDYHFMTVVCGKEVPVEVIDDYLIVRKCHSNYCLRGTAVLIINVKDGAMHVVIRNESDSEPRWFSTNGKYKELPFRFEAGYVVVKKAS